MVCRRHWSALCAAALLAARAALFAAETGNSTAAPDEAAGPSPARVVVVANSRNPDSEPIARYYMQRRGIPEKNLILIDAPTDSDITWTDFVEKIFNPLRYRLTKEGWLDAYVTDARDKEGRLRYAFFGNKIDFLVVCYGIPVRILNDPARLAASPPSPNVPQFNTNQASVDSELSLLAALDTPTAGLVANPLYNKLHPDSFTRSLVVRVARLDGPGIVAVRGLIDSALAGETQGLQGRAYIDMGGPHPEGDQWLAQASASLRKLGFDISEDHASTLFTWRQRFDAPAFYYGWYSYGLSGPIADADFHFPPGAIAIHIHSYSAEMIRDPHQRWVGPLVARGVAATVGNVFEPYLDFTHHIDLFMEGLAEGLTTGEAAYYSLPVLSWQSIFVGDPLYRPFATDLPTQLASAAKDPSPLAAYAVIRQMNLLQEQGQLAEALAVGQEFYAAHPQLALAFSIAQVEAVLNREDDALDLLKAAPLPDDVPRDQLGLCCEIARWAMDHHGLPLALTFYTKALASPEAVPEFSKAALPEAISVAKELDANDQAAAWQKQLDAFNPHP